MGESPLKVLREEAGLTQEALGAAVEISQSRYSNYENGHRPLPADVARKLATALSGRLGRPVLMDDLYAREGAEPSRLAS